MIKPLKPLPEQLIWDIYDPKLEMIRGSTVYMVHMWGRKGVDMGYNTPYHSHILHCYCSRLWKM